NAQVFRAGETIAARRLDGRAEREQIEAGLLGLTAEIAAAAKRRGVISPPFAPASGPPDIRLDPAVLLETLDRVQAGQVPVEVRGVAVADAYTLGPGAVTVQGSCWPPDPAGGRGGVAGAGPQGVLPRG